MGDVLPAKKQIVIDRLKRRVELYRRHQNACFPRYEQATNGLYETQRQETLLLKQRFLESKAKKAKNNKSDHHRTYKESTDGPKLQLHAKPIKRPAEEAALNPGTECANGEDVEKPAKIPRTDAIQDKPPATELQQQHPLPSFSVQIVQQFTKTPHSQQSQTIQTNVTVQALSKPVNSPIPQAQTVTVSQQVQETTVADQNQNNVSIGTNVECKQEKDCSQPDVCQFKSNQTSNSSGDNRLSDTFPSLGFTDESGDDVIHPDLLKDLIDDVFTNSADLMKDFNFDDSVGSMKDHEETAKDIMDLVKGTSPSQQKNFQTDSLSFASTPNNQSQQNGLFRSISSSNESPISMMPATTSTPVTTVSSFFNAPSQRMTSYSNPGLSLPSGLGLDFKLTEPSPAALTLKQMAEQHQNMQQKQQQQLVNSPLSNRPSPFNQDSYSNHMNALRPPNYLNGPSTTVNSPKTPNSNTHIFSSFDRPINNYPESMKNFPGTEPLSNFPGTEPLSAFQNCEPISPNIFEQEIRSRNSVVIADADRSKQQRLQQMDNACHQVEQPKPPAYGATRPLTHYSDSTPVRVPGPSSNQHQRMMGRQFQNSTDIRVQMTHQQHMHAAPTQQHSAQQLQQSSNELKHHHMMQPHSNMYVNYTSQQPMNNPAFHVSMSQSMSYSTQYTPSQAVGRHPPEYKDHHPGMPNDNLHIVEQLNASSPMMYNNAPKNKYVKQQRAPNVTITPDGSVIPASANWRHDMVNPQHPNQFRMRSFPQQTNYDIMRSEQLNSTVPAPMYNQYRMVNSQIPPNRIVRPNMMSANHMMMQRQRTPMPQRLRSPSVTDISHHPSLVMNSIPMSQASVMGTVYSHSQDLSRQDGSQINLDFLDNIESSASDLLNFDQVMQGGESHFPLLDEMEILNK